MKTVTPFHSMHAFGNAHAHQLVVTASKWGEEATVRVHLHTGKVERRGDREVAFALQHWLSNDMRGSNALPRLLPPLVPDDSTHHQDSVTDYCHLLEGRYTAEHMMGLFCVAHCTPQEEVVATLRQHIQANVRDMPVSEMLCTQQALSHVDSNDAFIDKWLLALLTHVCLRCRNNGFACLTASAQSDAAVAELSRTCKLRCNVCGANSCFSITRASMLGGEAWVREGVQAPLPAV
jgi:hypothetical protein